jgi:hypothetical protein
MRVGGYSYCGSSKCCSGRCIWDWYFSLAYRAIKQVLAYDLCTLRLLSRLLHSPPPQPESFSLPELTVVGFWTGFRDVRL